MRTVHLRLNEPSDLRRGEREARWQLQLPLGGAVSCVAVHADEHLREPPRGAVPIVLRAVVVLVQACQPALVPHLGAARRILGTPGPAKDLEPRPITAGAGRLVRVMKELYCGHWKQPEPAGAEPPASPRPCWAAGGKTCARAGHRSAHHPAPPMAARSPLGAHSRRSDGQPS